MKMNSLPTSSSLKRRARVHSLIQLGGLLELAGTLDIFGIPLGVNLQKDESLKNNIASLFKGFLELNKMATSSEVDLNLWALQGLKAFKEKGVSKERPLDKRKDNAFTQGPENNNESKSFINTHQS